MRNPLSFWLNPVQSIALTLIFKIPRYVGNLNGLNSVEAQNYIFDGSMCCHVGCDMQFGVGIHCHIVKTIRARGEFELKLKSC